MRCKLGDISEITKLAGYEFTKYIKYIPDGEIIAVRALNLKNGALVLDDIQRISKEVSETLPRSQLHKNDIVLSYSRGFVPRGKLPLFITPLLWFCYAVEARF